MSDCNECVPVPVGAGVELPVHRKRADGSYQVKRPRVRRGQLCSNWFKVKCNESGHLELYQAGHDEPELRGAPQVCGLSDLAKADGWSWGEPPKDKPKPAPKPESKPQSKPAPKPEPAK